MKRAFALIAILSILILPACVSLGRQFREPGGEHAMLAVGQRTMLRIGYVLSAGGEYLNPALAALRRSQPEIKVALHDLSPGVFVEHVRDVVDLAAAGAGAGRRVAATAFAMRVLPHPGGP